MQSCFPQRMSALARDASSLSRQRRAAASPLRMAAFTSIHCHFIWCAHINGSATLFHIRAGGNLPRGFRPGARVVMLNAR